MIKGIVEKEHVFVLKDERGVALTEQTRFYIVPKTVKSANKTAARYAGVAKTDKKTGEQKYNVDRMNAVDIEEWLGAVKRVENFYLPFGVAGGGDVYCKTLVANGNETITQDEGGFIVIDTTDEELLKFISWAMSPDQHEEVMNAYYNYSALTEEVKNA